jgi:hypothetical protein
VILHQPEIDRIGGDICVSSRVETRTRMDYLPSRLRYRFPVTCTDSLSSRADPFLVSLLPLAMSLGENLHVHGAVSPRLLSGLGELQEHLHGWHPTRFKRVTLNAECIEPPFLPNSPRGKLLGFSGGLDSFFTLWCATQSGPDHPLHIPLTHAFFVHGFDIPLENQDAYRRVQSSFAALFQDLGVTLIPVQTNVRYFSQLRINWLHMYTFALVGIALSLHALVDRLFIAAANMQLGMRPLVSARFSDPWLSTEGLEVVYHGGGISRMEKMAVVAGWPSTYDRLLVCTRENKVGMHNCGKCEKCLRVMANLELAGHSGIFSTLPREISGWNFLRWAFLLKMKAEFSIPILRRAWQTRRYGIWLWMLLVFALGKIRKGLRALIIGALPEQVRFRLKAIIYGVKRDPLDNRQSRGRR